MFGYLICFNTTYRKLDGGRWHIGGGGQNDTGDDALHNLLSKVRNLLEVAALGAISAAEIEDEHVDFRVAF
jgi:hypothetical protein